ncbi:primase-helicase family protein [Azospirillum baldaniorum]|nr:primase-helicase family protein [Azospirillum baldaniorum]
MMNPKVAALESEINGLCTMIAKLEAIPEDARSVTKQKELVAAQTKRRKLQEQIENMMGSPVSEGEILTAEDSLELDLQALLNETRAFLEQHEVYYVATGNLFIEYNPVSKDWTIYQEREFKGYYHQFKAAKNMAALDMVMWDMGRKFKRLTYTFDRVDSDTLNLMRRDHWLQPIRGQEPHWFFHVLAIALGGEKAENVEHLEKVLSFKYRHPEEYRLPCLVIYGQGGVGKSLLAELIFPTVFGAIQVKSCRPQEVLGDFNDGVKGKTVVLLNEAVAERVDMEAFKNLIHSPYMTVNEKFLPRFQCGNTPLYICGGNGVAGAIKLGGDESDRRWSIIRVTRSLVTILAEFMEAMEMDLEGCPSYAALAKKWIDDNNATRLCRDPVEVAKWLGYLIDKHQEESVIPALDNTDKVELWNTQKTEDQVVFEHVFLVPEFSHITLDTLYEVYKWQARKHNPGGTLKKIGTIREAGLDFLRKHRPEIEYREVKIDKSSKMAFVHRLSGTRLEGNDRTYVDRLPNGSVTNCFVEFL